MRFRPVPARKSFSHPGDFGRRRRVGNLAIANLPGSDLFNLVVPVIADVTYLPGPLRDDVSIVHAGAALAASTMTGWVIVGLAVRPQRRVLRMVS